MLLNTAQHMNALTPCLLVLNTYHNNIKLLTIEGVALRVDICAHRAHFIRRKTLPFGTIVESVSLY